MIFEYTGPFSTKPLEDAGFHCPKLELALRNPLKISKFASKVIQDGGKNLLDYGVLRSPIDTSSSLNIVDGQLIKFEKDNFPFQEAVKETLKKIPYGRYALIFIDDRDLSENVLDEIKDLFHSRPEPQIFTETDSTSDLRKWLCEPQKRRNDMCIIGSQHQCNGIETDIVIHIYPEDCPWCGISNADPVIISRAMALLIISKYERVKCGFSGCGWVSASVTDNHEETNLIEPENTPNPSMRKFKVAAGILGSFVLLILMSTLICLYVLKPKHNGENIPKTIKHKIQLLLNAYILFTNFEAKAFSF